MSLNIEFKLEHQSTKRKSMLSNSKIILTHCRSSDFTASVTQWQSMFPYKHVTLRFFSLKFKRLTKKVLKKLS